MLGKEEEKCDPLLEESGKIPALETKLYF